MIEMLILLAVLLVAGAWTKHTNTLYMRKLAAEVKEKYKAKPPTKAYVSCECNLCGGNMGALGTEWKICPDCSLVEDRHE